MHSVLSLAGSTRLGLAVALLMSARASGAPVEFNRDVRPILSDRCFACHGPDNSNRKSKLRLDTEAGARAGVVPGSPDKSPVYIRITSENKTLRMPPAYAGHERLKPREVETIAEWIRQGAKWQSHWSFIPPVRPVPPPAAPGWARNPIDHFVLARLEREGLRPSPEADKERLLRRVTLDLTGLPPAPAEIDSFIADQSPTAYEKVVDRLLSSHRYGERMAIRWLEAARYADTNGYQSDGERSMWRWRDWVIDAYRRNMPFDQFTIEQIAGDMLPNATLDQKIASAFHRNHRTSAEGGIVEEEFRVEYVADRAETTSTVWLGLTLGCARCHDHKYDPLPQKDFYRFFAFFNNVPERGLVYNFGNEEPFIKAPTPAQAEKLQTLEKLQADAEKRYAALADEIVKAQRKWEKSLRKQPPLDWFPAEGLVLRETLDRESAPGKIGNAVRLDGSRYVDAGDVANFNYLQPFTLSAWINPAAPTGAIMSRIEEWLEGEGYGLYVMDGKLRLHITKRWTDISLRVETEKPLALNQWQHVLVTYDGYRKGSGVHMYVNGERQPLKILFDELTYPLGAKEPFRIGAGGGDKYNFQGLIDDVRVWKLALTPEQASTVWLLDDITTIAAKRPEKRSPAEANKLALCFLDRFAPNHIRESLAAMRQAQAERKRFFESIQTVMVMKENDRPRDTFVLKRGAYDAPGEPVAAGVPAILPQISGNARADRLDLARWLVSRNNPLTARVAVNRYWQMLFGTGLVKTSEDFGSQGEWPMHPELLDWLAVEFMDSGWNIRHILKTIVTSATYRQSSRLTPQLLERDPENRLLARGPRLRLSAEMIRDQALAASGLLVEKQGGPSVKPYQPAGLWQELAGGGGYKPDRGEGLYRRSLYTYWKRTIAPPSMVNFDSPTRESCSVREVRTNTPLQALNLMNDVTYLEAARKLAERMLREGSANPLQYGFRLVLGRHPSASESSKLQKALGRFEAHYAADSGAATNLLMHGESPRDKSLDPVKHAAYTAIASLLLNLDEAITKE